MCRAAALNISGQQNEPTPRLASVAVITRGRRVRRRHNDILPAHERRCSPDPHNLGRHMMLRSWWAWPDPGPMRRPGLPRDWHFNLHPAGRSASAEGAGLAGLSPAGCQPEIMWTQADGNFSRGGPLTDALGRLLVGGWSLKRMRLRVIEA